MTEHKNLSGREIEILKLVAKGLTNREIALKLTISPNTVKVHLSNVFEKISVASRTEATLYGIEHGFVDVPGGVEALTPIQRPSWRERVRKYAWVGIPLALLIVLFIVTFILNVLLPPPAPETPAMAELAERWRELAPMPAARAAMAAAAYDGEIYAIAGEGPEGVSGSVFRYSPGTDSWVQLADKPTPVADVHGVLIGEKIYVPGGRLADGRPTDILEIYDPRRDAWGTGAPLPQPVSAYALADFEGQMVLFGGWDGERALDVVYVYDPGADAWREGTNMATARRDAGAVALADKIVVLGGRNAAGVLKEAVSYFPSRDGGGEDPWEGFVALPEGRYGFGVASVYETINLIGGFTESADMVSDAEILNFTDGLWARPDVKMIQNSFSPKMITIGSLLYFINTINQGELSELWSYKAFSFDLFIPIIQ